MKPLYRGLLVTVVQCLLVLSVAGKYALDRERLPRVWAQAVPRDPNLFVRGRYVSLQLRVEGQPPQTAAWTAARLTVEDGRLVAIPDSAGSVHVNVLAGREILVEPVAYFIPDNVPDPSMRRPGEELWVEVSVPARGAPRPIRLAVKKDDILTPLVF